MFWISLLQHSFCNSITVLLWGVWNVFGTMLQHSFCNSVSYSYSIMFAHIYRTRLIGRSHPPSNHPQLCSALPRTSYDKGSPHMLLTYPIAIESSRLPYVYARWTWRYHCCLFEYISALPVLFSAQRDIIIIIRWPSQQNITKYINDMRHDGGWIVRSSNSYSTRPLCGDQKACSCSLKKQRECIYVLVQLQDS